MKTIAERVKQGVRLSYNTWPSSKDGIDDGTVRYGRFENSCFVGYYGGLNYGDELLMECIQAHLEQANVNKATFLYSRIDTAPTYHGEYDYDVVERTIPSTLKAFFTHKQIVIGGGGHWGLDTNLNIVLLSLLLLVFRILGKKITLLNVGYYNSARGMGRTAAWFAAKAANAVYARDQESYDNFIKLNKRVVLSEDIAESLSDLDLEGVPGLPQIDKLAQKNKIVITSVRRFTSKPDIQKKYEQALESYLSAKNSSQVVCIAMMEPESVDPEGYAYAKKVASTYKSVHVIAFDYNPISLYVSIQKNPENIRIAGLQYHLLLVALKAGATDVWGVSYDNKCAQILAKNKIKSKQLTDITPADFAIAA